ncbi:hypothetical protein C0J52_07064 [Blattella germanica]|nr:hypothetical protein C0J52_07064 [Blattella germanica]
MENCQKKLGKGDRKKHRPRSTVGIQRGRISRSTLETYRDEVIMEHEMSLDSSVSMEIPSKQENIDNTGQENLRENLGDTEKRLADRLKMDSFEGNTAQTHISVTHIGKPLEGKSKEYSAERKAIETITRAHEENADPEEQLAHKSQEDTAEKNATVSDCSVEENPEKQIVDKAKENVSDQSEIRNNDQPENLTMKTKRSNQKNRSVTFTTDCTIPTSELWEIYQSKDETLQVDVKLNAIGWDYKKLKKYKPRRKNV